jgi:uncharacterized protein involved in outer membrane biogenesis
MNRITRWLGLAVATVLCLLAGLAAMLYFTIDEQRLKSAATEFAATRLGATLRIDGELALGLLPQPTLSVAGIGLSMNADGAPELLSAEQVRLGVRLAPLLNGELAFDEATVTGLRINAVREADGRTNWESKTSAAQPAPTTDGAPAQNLPAEVATSSPTPGLTVARVRVSNGGLALEDKGTGTVNRVELDSLSADGFNLEGRPFALATTGRLVSGSGEQQGTVGIDLAGNLGLDASAWRATLADMRLQMSPAEGNALSVQAGQLIVDREGALEITDGTLNLGGLALGGIRASAHREGAVTVLSALQATAYDGTLQASGRRDPGAQDSVSLEAKLTGIDLLALQKAFGKPERIEGRLDGTLRLGAHGGSPAEWRDSLVGPVSISVRDPVLREISVEETVCKAAATLNQEQLTTAFPQTTPLGGLEAALDFHAGVGSFRTLAATLPSMALDGEGRIDLPQRKLKVHVDARITRDLGEVDPACRMTRKMLSLEWPITCRGGFDEDPQQWCRVDSDDVAKIARQLATEKLGDKIRDKLRGFFGND